MGLFDKILKEAAKAIDDAVEKSSGSKGGFTDLFNQAMDMKNEAIHGTTTTSTTPPQKKSAPPPPTSSSKTSQAAFEEANLPAKPSRLVEEISYGDDEEDIKYSFMLSGDFVQFSSGAAEIDYGAMFLPAYVAEDGQFYCEYDSSRPAFLVCSAAENEIYKAIDNYKKTGAQPSGAYMYEPVNQGKIYYKAKINNRGEILYMYGMDREPFWENCYIGVQYNPDVIGTALESRLIAAVDEAVRTYKEVPTKAD